MAANDNQKTVYTTTGMFGGMMKPSPNSPAVYCCKCCGADLTNVDKLSHKCNDYELFRTALKYRQMLEDICNSIDVEGVNVSYAGEVIETFEEAVIDKDTINLAREVLGWEKL